MRIDGKTAVLAMLILGVFLIFSAAAAAVGDFVPVADIIDVPGTATVGVPLTLSGTVLPLEADKKDITWSIKDAGETGATITGNIFNTLGAGTVVATATVEGGLAGDGIAAIAAGRFHSMAIKEDGSLWVWGYNAFGQLGVGNTISSPVPIRLGTDADWGVLAPGLYHTAALKTDGSLWTWGWNFNGQLGDGTVSPTKISTSPSRIGTDNDWATLASGNSHTLAIKTDGSLWAWGLNSNGQLGDGSAIQRNAPTRIGTENNWAKLAGGGNYTLAIKKDGSLWSWGQNSFGQLGNDSTDESFFPIRIGAADDWMTVATGTYHSLALKTDGSLWVWGGNASGQLGDGTIFNHTSPVRLGAENNWAALAAGGTHSTALKTDGSLWSWGYNEYGQLGNGSFTYYNNIPAQIGSESDWAMISAGDHHSMGLKKDTRLFDWGYNNYGQVGDDTIINKNVPTLVKAGADFIKDFSITAGDSRVYTVNFVDWNDTVLKTERVAHGLSATAPATPSRIGYIFKGWDKDFTNITGDLTVKALYEYDSNYNYFVYVESAQTEVKAGEYFYLNVMLVGNFNYTQVLASINYDSELFEYIRHIQLTDIATEIKHTGPNNFTARSAPAVNLLIGAPCQPPVMVAQLEFKVKDTYTASSSADFSVPTATVYPTALVGISGIKIGPGNTITIDLNI